jgi:ATP-dependent Lon protease
VLGFLSRDLERFDTEKQISARVKQQMDANQREYYLREQMKAIQRELGSDDASEAEELRQKVEEKQLPETPRSAPSRRSSASRRWPAARPRRPWCAPTSTCCSTSLDRDRRRALDIAHTRAVLDEDHHALEEPKERILEFLAVRSSPRTARRATTRRRSCASSARPASARRRWASRSPAA